MIAVLVVSLALSSAALILLGLLYKKQQEQFAEVADLLNAYEDRIQALEDTKENLREFYQKYYGQAAAQRAKSNGNAAGARPSGWA